jgi:hypothetical protein
VEVELPLKVEINVQEGAQPSMKVSGYENVAKHIKGTIKGNTLVITDDLDDSWDIKCDGMTVVLTVPSLTALSLSGAPDATIHGNVTGSEFKMDLSGACEVVIDNLNVDKLSSDMSGASEVTIKSGNVRVADYDISGAGDISAYGLQTKETSISISGAGDSKVSASEKLTASVSGAGEVKYKGHPSVSQNISGAGSVTAVN